MENKTEDIINIKKYLAGDETGLNIIIDKYYERILNFVFKYVKYQNNAEDITQEIFVKLINNMHKYNSDYAFSTYLYKIALNTIYDYLRKQKRANLFSVFFNKDENNIFELDIKDTRNNPEEELLNSEQHKIINTALNALPQRQKDALILVVYNNFSYKQIAEIMNTSEKAVEHLISRARETLKIKL